MRHPAARLLSPALAPLCALLLAACGAKPAEQAAPPPTPVHTAPVRVQTLPVTAEAVGNVEALASVAIKSRVDGQIAEVRVRDGQDVKKGELLMRIDARPYEIQLRQAEANLARDKALHDAAVAQEKRYGELQKQGFVTPDQYAQIKGNLDTLAAAVQTDQGLIDNARLLLDYTQIRAPISGRLGKIALQAGNLVKANDTTALVTINQLDPVYVSFSLREQLLPDVRAALAAAPKVQAFDPQGRAQPAEGQLSFIDNSVDAATGTIRLRATFANPDKRLWPGQFVRLVLQLGEEHDALTIPANAVLTGPKGTYAFVVDAQSKAQQREIEVRRSTADTAVIARGLAANERVIVDGHSRVAPGAAVSEPSANTAPAAGAAPAKD